MKHRRIFVGVVILLLLASCREQPTQPNLLIIGIDTLRFDRLGCYGYAKNTSPNIDRFADDGVVFLRNYSQSPWTMPSFASIMTSLYPRVHQSAIRKYEGDEWYVAREQAKTTGKDPRHSDYFTLLREDITTLAETLQANGYTTEAVISVPSIPNIFRVLRQGFDEIKTFEHDTDNEHGWATADYVSDFTIDWLGKNRNRSFFLMLHYFDPHGPYQPPEPYKSQFFVPEEKDEIKRQSALYDGEIAFVDHEIGRVLRRLKKLRLDKRTIVVIIADHGEEFGEHGNTGHGHSLYDELIHVPFIIKYKAKLKPSQYAGITRSIDVMPTVLAMMGIDPPEGIQGRNLLPDIQKTPSTGIYAFSEALSMGPELYSLRNEKETYIWDATDGTEVTETRDEAALNLIKDIRAANEGLVGSAEQRTVKVEDEVKETLRALGYLN